MEQHMEHLEEASSAESPAFPSTFENINNRKNNRQESRKGIPWTEEEHRWGFFISTVKGTGETFPGTATQVATHAQKYYYLRQLSEGKEKMKPSIASMTLQQSIALMLLHRTTAISIISEVYFDSHQATEFE